MKRIIKKVQGITLVALVVTIVVLLILAAVTINMAVSNTGLFARAKNSTAAYQAAEANESEGLTRLEDKIDEEMGIVKPIDTSKLAESTTGVIVTDKQTKHTDGTKVAVIPAGFCVVGGTIPTGLVISDVAADDLANSKGGNQYVWIPCTMDGSNGSIKYDRYAFTRSGWINSQTKNETNGEIKLTDDSGLPPPFLGVYTETIDSVEQTSVSKYGGFYIGRYEAGDSEATANKEQRKEEGESGPASYNKNDNKAQYKTKIESIIQIEKAIKISNTGDTSEVLVVKKAQAPYNYVTRDEAKSLAEGIKSANNYIGITASKLCSSYAWDTALTFVDTVKSGYSTNATANTMDNCYDTTFTYKDLTGVSQTKATSSSTIVPTGETTPVANIYDLGGNVWEWTTEAYSDSFNPCVIRGGVYGNTSLDVPAGVRDYNLTTSSFDYVGFRPTLYL